MTSNSTTTASRQELPICSDNSEIIHGTFRSSAVEPVHHLSDVLLGFPRLVGPVIKINHVLGRLVAVSIIAPYANIYIRCKCWRHPNTDPAVLEMKSFVNDAALAIPGVHQMHGFVIDGNEIGFDIVVDFDCDTAQAKEQLTKNIHSRIPDARVYITIDKNYS